jgi:hypothetical protein
MGGAFSVGRQEESISTQKLALRSKERGRKPDMKTSYYFNAT